MRVYAYIYICIYIGEYVCVCVWTHVNICEGPYQPLRFGRRGCCFYKSMSTKSDWYTASPYGLVDPQLPHSSDREYYIPLSESVTAVYPLPLVPSCTPTSHTYCWPATNKKEATPTSLLSVLSLTTSTLVPDPIRTDIYFWLWTAPHQTHTQRSPKARSPTACTHITTRSQTNHI